MKCYHEMIEVEGKQKVRDDGDVALDVGWVGN